MKENGGYARSYNILMHAYFKKGFDFCLLINIDTKADPRLVSSLVETYQSKKKEGIKVGLIQPIITLMKDPTKLNTMGNAVHISGIGYCPDLGKPLNIAPHRDVSISSVSGCCMFVSKDYFERVGGFDER
jgi:GT2 family glycosyltransferase